MGRLQGPESTNAGQYWAPKLQHLTCAQLLVISKTQSWELGKTSFIGNIQNKEQVLNICKTQHM